MYCSVDDLVSRFDLNELIQLTDSGNTGNIDTVVVTAAITDASNLIDGYLGGRYTLPLVNVPAVLIRICTSIARYNLYDNSVTEVVQKHYDDAIKFLQAVGKGELTLGLSSDNETAESESVIEMQSSAPVFGRDNSSGFI